MRAMILAVLLAAPARLAFGDELSDSLLSDPHAWHRVVLERVATVHQIERAWRRLDAMNEPQPAKRGRLIDLIAKLRIVECADLPVDRLETPALAIDEPAPLASFPAGAALVEIGSPVFPALYRRIEQGASERQLRIIALIFMEIDGPAIAHSGYNRPFRSIFSERIFKVRTSPTLGTSVVLLRS